MVIERIGGSVKLSREIRRSIDALPKVSGLWDSSQRNVEKFKKMVRTQLEVMQKNKCAYCGLKLKETSRVEIEHVAPKGGVKRPQYPQFAFTLRNLVCSYCNSSSKKGTTDSILTYSDRYRECDFAIVHPYYDAPDEHYEWDSSHSGIIIKAISAKGVESVKLFELDSVVQTEARAKLAMYEQARARSQQDQEKLIAEALSYMRGGR